MEPFLPSISAPTEKLWCMFEAQSACQEVFLQQILMAKMKEKLKSFNDQLVNHWKLGEVKEMTYKGWNDEPVQMWVIHPPDFDPKKKWPLLACDSWRSTCRDVGSISLSVESSAFCKRGFVVAGVNFHGSTGFGDNIYGFNTQDSTERRNLQMSKKEPMHCLPQVISMKID